MRVNQTLDYDDISSTAFRVGPIVRGKSSARHNKTPRVAVSETTILFCPYSHIIHTSAALYSCN